MKQSRPILDRDRKIPGCDLDARRALKTPGKKTRAGGYVQLIGFCVAKKNTNEQNLLPKQGERT
jgi:hypothetical protein